MRRSGVFRYLRFERHSGVALLAISGLPIALHSQGADELAVVRGAAWQHVAPLGESGQGPFRGRRRTHEAPGRGIPVRK